MFDPLLLLRAAVLQDVNEPPIAFYDNFGATVDSIASSSIIGLSGSLFAKDADTNYKSKRGTGPFYALEAVVFLVLHRDSSYTEYLQEARAHNVPVVSLVDKKELLDYVSTASADCPYVDLSAPLAPAATFESEVPAEAAILEEASMSKSPKKRRPATERKALIKARSSNAPIILPDGKRAIRVRLESDYYTSNRDFSFAAGYARHLVKEIDSALQSEDSKSKVASSLMDQISAMHVGQQQPAKRSRKSAPIILVPNAPSSLISIYNVKEFLENGTWIPPTEAKQRTAERPTRVAVKNKVSGKEYVVIDNPEQCLTSTSQWDDVVATFLVGAQWQFKGWRWEQPVEIFQHMQGFFVHFDDLKVDGPVSTWKVQRLPLSRSRRHLDATVAMDFWKQLD